MTSVCLHGSSERLTLYYYGELSPDERRAMEEHVASCGACASALEELELVRSALASRAATGRTAADWDAFMRRLLPQLDRPGGSEWAMTGVRPERTSVSAWANTQSRPARISRGLAVAAALVLGVGSGLMWQRHALGPTIDTEAVDAGGTDAALGAAASRHFERAKLVVLGIAMKDPAASSPADWEYERQLAASLLPETRLFRLSAADRGDARLASLLGDLESVLLEASMATDAEAPELQRLQRAIERRDLLVRMDLREL